MKNKWFALICGYTLFIASAVAFFQFPPLINHIDAEIGLSDVDVGLIQGFYALPAVLLALAGGLFIDSVNSRSAGLWSGLALLAGNLLFTIADSVLLMLIGRLIVGVATIIINLVAAKMLTIWFPREQRGLSMSVLHTSWPISATVAYSFFVDLGDAFGWRLVLLAVCGFCALVLVLFYFLAPSDPEMAVEDDKESLSPLKHIVRMPASLWLTAVAWFLFASGMIGLLTFGAKHLESLGISYHTGSFWVGLLMMAAIPGSLAAGWLMDRFGSDSFYLISAPPLICLCFVLFISGFWPGAMMVAAGLLGSFPPIAVYSLPGELVGPRRLGLAFGIILTFSNLGNTLSPIVLGWVNQISGNYSFGLFIAAAIMALIAASGIAIRLLAPKKSGRSGSPVQILSAR